MKYLICDIDGTIANDSHRAPLVQDYDPPLWNEYFDGCAHDRLIANTAAVVQALAQRHVVVFVTGRPRWVRAATKKWLLRHGFSPKHLVMRNQEVHPHDCSEFKVQELLRWYPQATPENTLCVLEDRTPLVQLWRRHGYVTFQVAQADF